MARSFNKDHRSPRATMVNALVKAYNDAKSAGATIGAVSVSRIEDGFEVNWFPEGATIPSTNSLIIPTGSNVDAQFNGWSEQSMAASSVGDDIIYLLMLHEGRQAASKKDETYD